MELGKGAHHIPSDRRKPSSRNGAQLLELGKGSPSHRPHNTSESQWSPAFGAGKSASGTASDHRAIKSQWSPAFGAGKSGVFLPQISSWKHVAMEPSFWSWEKLSIIIRILEHPRNVAMEPSFWSWEKLATLLHHVLVILVAMEPSFWSWEKTSVSANLSQTRESRNGAQLLELGKVLTRETLWRGTNESQWSPAFGAGKSTPHYHCSCPNRRVAMEPSFWSWEKMWKLVKEDLGLSGRNGAQLLELGKVHHCSNIRTRNHRRNGAQLLELGKELAIFSPTDYQCCTSLRAAEVLGQMSRVVAP